MSTQGVSSAQPEWGKLIDPYMVGGCAGLDDDSHENVACAEAADAVSVDFGELTENVIVQNTNIISSSSSLFYTPVIVEGKLTLGGMLDSGSMACTMSEKAEAKLLDAGVLTKENRSNFDAVLIGCGGTRVKPKSAYDIEMEVYGCKIIVPTLVVQGQLDELIIGTNVIKHVLRESKRCPAYWNALSHPCLNDDQESERFLSMLAGMERWKGEEIPDKIGTVRCTSAVCLEPGREYLVWGKLNKSCVISPGSTVITEPTTSRSAPRHVLVARLVTPLWGDGWVPLKLINLSHQQVLLRRNAKIADLFACVALEDLENLVLTCNDDPLFNCTQRVDSRTCLDRREDLVKQLEHAGLGALDINSCEASEDCKNKLRELILQYENIFSRHHLDCGKAEGFVHRIHVTDTKPFRLPYRRIPPSQYQVLRKVLDEMEEREIIRKSTSEFASPLVLVWKKNGDLRICTDFRWLNRRTFKDAYPLPHQADCLAALGGNCLFSTLDLTSGFYNMPLHDDDRKYSAFTTPVGLYEYNRLPQGLCNSPGSFMRMMTAIFGDQNFLSLLCYLDDLLVFAPNEKIALERLEMVFSRLSKHNLKLSPKKCCFLRRSVKFLGHIVDETGISTDPCKVDSIARMTYADLMEKDGVTPSQKRVRSFLGLINYYQHFIPKYSSIARPLFDLLSGQMKNSKGGWRRKRSLQSCKLRPEHWTEDQVRSFEGLKSSLINSVVLAHPKFDQPFILSTDASLDGLGAVLSQVQEGDTMARPIAFASKSLSRSQRNYPAHRLEFLALKWAVCDKFSHWLKGNKFTVCTDNNPLTHIMTKPKLDCCEQRWVAKLASYDFDIKYIPGSRNLVADALSREPFVHVGHRLLHEAFDCLRNNMTEMSDVSVQNAFRQSTNSDDQFPRPDSVFHNGMTFSSDEVSAVFRSHNDWETGAQVRAISNLHCVPQVVDNDYGCLPEIGRAHV